MFGVCVDKKDKDSVLFTQGNEIEYVYNKRNGKRYYPKNNLEIER